MIYNNKLLYNNLNIFKPRCFRVDFWKTDEEIVITTKLVPTLILINIPIETNDCWKHWRKVSIPFRIFFLSPAKLIIKNNNLGND